MVRRALPLNISPAMEFNQTIRAVRDALAQLYPDIESSRQIVSAIGLRSDRLRFDARASQNWYNILEEAAKHRGKIRGLVEYAGQDYPDNDLITGLLRFGTVEPDLPWRGPEAPDQLEKIISDRSYLVSVSFLAIGMQRVGPVALIRLRTGQRIVYGTGFLIEGNLLVTNAHVLGSEGAAKSASVVFNHQSEIDGSLAGVEEFDLNPDEGFYSVLSDDLTLVRVAGDPNSRWGSIPVAPAEITTDDRVNIIQHPGGQLKQMSLFHNVVTYVGNRRVQYLTDTLPGSSGSPVFDGDWRLVAVHHSGGLLTEPGTGRIFYRNEGIHVQALIEAWERARS